jgi:DsbC/DsbD-like thiol-disulfide interchange protein
VIAFDYAICERICVPVSGRAELTVPSVGSGEDAALAAAEARVPKNAAVGAGGGARLAIRAVEREGDWPRPRIVVEVAAPAGESVDLFAEGPGPDWALPVPEPAGAGEGGARRFSFALEGVPPGVDPKGATILLTAVSGTDAVEAPYRIE